MAVDRDGGGSRFVPGGNRGKGHRATGDRYRVGDRLRTRCSRFDTG